MGNKWLLGLVGSNDTTGGNCWFCYSHSSYYGEVPNKFLKDDNGADRLDSNGKEIKNPEYKNYTDIWGKPTENNKNNLSLPKVSDFREWQDKI